MRWYIVLALLVINHTLIAQEDLDVIYLKNGSILKGKIIEMNPSSDLKFQLNDGSVFVFKINEIEKMEKVQIPKSTVTPLNNSVDKRAIEQYFENYFK